MDNLDLMEQRAVDAAIDHHWQEAVDFNLQILKQDNANLAASLRLGFAYIQLKDFKTAKKYYHKALKVQPKNSVAQENLERIAILEQKGTRQVVAKTLFDANLFIEIPGKTRSVTLVNNGQKNVLAQLVVGQPLKIKIKKRRLEIRTEEDEYVGSLPDDLSKQLTPFIKAGSTYLVTVQSGGLGHVTVFIKEEKKGRAVLHRISFPHILNQKPAENADQSGDEEKNGEDSEDEELDEDSWEKLVSDLGSQEEKEEVIGINTENEEEEEE